MTWLPDNPFHRIMWKSETCPVNTVSVCRSVKYLPFILLLRDIFAPIEILVASMSWLPEGKKAAVCFSVDDVHPATSKDGYEAGGDLGNGALGVVESLLERHERLKVTLFVTPDWRPVQLVRSRALAGLRIFSELVYHVDLQPSGRFRLDRHPEFVDYLNKLPRAEVAPHGLRHVHRGSRLAVEFQRQGRKACGRILARSLAILDSAGLDYVSGFAPPGWDLPRPLVDALDDNGIDFVCSARDIMTPISRQSLSAMSGLRNVPLIYPLQIGRRSLVHVPVNFQATSSIERADRIIECNGLLSIKAHIFKHAGELTLKDGLDSAYAARLHEIFQHLESQHGESLWWASMDEIAARWRDAMAQESAVPAA